RTGGAALAGEQLDHATDRLLRPGAIPADGGENDGCEDEAGGPALHEDRSLFRRVTMKRKPCRCESHFALIVGGARPHFTGTRQRRCIHSHCSGCSRTQPSTTAVMAAMAPSTSISPFASRGRSIGGVSSRRKRRPGRRITRTPCTGQSKRRANFARIGLVLAGRSKKGTVTPR